MGWPQIDIRAQGAPGDGSPPSQPAADNILNGIRDGNDFLQDGFRTELRQLRLASDLAPTDGTAPGRGWLLPNRPLETGTISNFQADVGQTNAGIRPGANADSTQINAGSSTNQPPADSDSRSNERASHPFFSDGINNWGLQNILAGGYGAIGAQFLRSGDAAVGRAFGNALCANALITGANYGLDYMFPSVGGHHLFKNSSAETIGIGVAAGLPISDLRLKAGLIGAVWLTGRVANYFEN